MWQPSLYSSWIVIVSHKICSSRSGSFGRVLRVLSIVQFTQMWHYTLQTGTEKTFCNDTKLNVQEKCGIQIKENILKEKHCTILWVLFVMKSNFVYVFIGAFIVHILFPAVIPIKIAWFIAIYFWYAKTSATRAPLHVEGIILLQWW